MFVGNHSHTIDTKGRIIIPAKMREELGERCIITQGLDSCLAVYSLELFQQKAAKLKTLPQNKAAVRAMQRHFFGNAAEVEFDRQGRILVPATLRHYAKLQKEAVVAGNNDYIEIWNREQWEAYNQTMADSIEGLMEEMEGFSF